MRGKQHPTYSKQISNKYHINSLKAQNMRYLFFLIGKYGVGTNFQNIG